MKQNLFWISVCLAVALPGCDGAQASSSENLIGSWLRGSGANPLRWTFGDDGTFAMGDDANPEVIGVYEATDVALQIDLNHDDPDERDVLQATYYASDRELVLSAILPDGATSGLIGSWIGYYHITSMPASISDDHVDVNLAFRSDGTMSWSWSSVFNAGGPVRDEMFEGTYSRSSAGDVELSLTDDGGGQQQESLRFIDGQILYVTSAGAIFSREVD